MSSFVKKWFALVSLRTFRASAEVLRFGSPRFAASSVHSCPYPSPLKTTLELEL